MYAHNWWNLWVVLISTAARRQPPAIRPLWEPWVVGLDTATLFDFWQCASLAKCLLYKVPRTLPQIESVVCFFLATSRNDALLDKALQMRSVAQREGFASLTLYRVSMQTMAKAQNMNLDAFGFHCSFVCPLSLAWHWETLHSWMRASGVLIAKMFSEGISMTRVFTSYFIALHKEKQLHMRHRPFLTYADCSISV